MSTSVFKPKRASASVQRAATLAEAIDEYALLIEKLKPLNKKLASLKKRLLDEAPLGANGKLFKFEVAETEVMLLDTEKIYNNMDETWIKKHQKLSTRRSLIFSKR